MAAERKRVLNDYEEDQEDGKPKKIPKTLTEKDTQKRLIVILERANLETIKVSLLITPWLVYRREVNAFVCIPQYMLLPVIWLATLLFNVFFQYLL